MLSDLRCVTGTVTNVTTPAGAQGPCESIPCAVDAKSLPDAQVPRHPECGSHPGAGTEISKFGWGGARANSGGRRAGAGRKPASKELAQSRIAASIHSLAWPGALGDRWYCARTHYRAELIAIEELVRQGYPAFLPRIERELPDHQRILVPMFPGYLFVRFDRGAERWRPVVSTPGIRCLLGVSPELPIPAPFGMIEALASRANDDGTVLRHRHPRVEPIPAGETVRIANGPFTSFEAVCLMSAGDRVRVLVALFGREVEAELARGDVERVGAA